MKVGSGDQRFPDFLVSYKTGYFMNMYTLVKIPNFKFKIRDWN